MEEPNLKELFQKADEIGNKYLTAEEIKTTKEQLGIVLNEIRAEIEADNQ